MLQAPMIEPRGHQPAATLGLDGGVWRARSDADDSYDELAVAGTGKDVVLMATGVKFSDRAKPPH
jgi:hypothetical protein